MIRLIREDPAFRDEVRRVVLSEELLGLPDRFERFRTETERHFERVWRAIESLTQRIEALTARVEALAEAQRRTDERLEALAEAQRRTEEQIRVLTEAQRRTDEQLKALVQAQERINERLEALAEAQRRTEERLEALIVRVDALTQTIGRIEERWGLAHEQIAQDLVPDILRRKGWKVIRASPLMFDGEMDVVVAVEADGKTFTVAAEVKGRLWNRTPIDQVRKKVHHPEFLAALRRQGFPEPVLPALFALVVYAGVEEAARQGGVGLFSFHGEVVPPPPVP